MDEQYKPGALTRRYYRATHPKPITSVEILAPPPTITETLAKPDQLVNIRDIDTISVPAMRGIQPLIEDGPQTEYHRPALRIPHHLVYRRVDPPLLMLYGASLAFLNRFATLPAALFVEGSMIPVIWETTQIMTGCAYDGTYRIITASAMDGKIKRIPIFTEAQLPDMLRWRYPKMELDMVIAIAEC